MEDALAGLTDDCRFDVEGIDPLLQSTIRADRTLVYTMLKMEKDVILNQTADEDEEQEEEGGERSEGE